MGKLLDEMNYLLLSLSIEDRVTGGAEGVAKELIKSGCRQLIVGKSIDFDAALGYCVRCGLAYEDGVKVRITHLGRRFAELNRSMRYEANERQIALLREMLPRTHFGMAAGKLINEERAAAPSEDRGLLRDLGLLTEVQGKESIDKGFARSASAAASGTVTDEELEEHLRENRTYGAKAEEFVARYESERLVREGMIGESKKVRRIGNLDVTKGYDIESFTNPGTNPNRFIEVKCTKNPFLRFYWSANEVEVAKELGDRYFIYFVWMNEYGEPTGDVEMFQDPVKSILVTKGKFSISVGTYVVKSI